uniref:Putative secreted peptide n=1 Tax=Anopheles braziliensis TaxID=58242 RepID=A0A2M3ZW50_9DIPT
MMCVLFCVASPPPVVALNVMPGIGKGGTSERHYYSIRLPSDTGHRAGGRCILPTRAPRYLEANPPNASPPSGP